MKLDPSESFRNMGTLKVDVISAKNLPSADRNGYSDPFCKFRLNDVKVHETAKKKKTLNPEWNETFEAPVRSRTAAKFLVEVWDWDFGDSNDLLGKAMIDLSAIEAFQRKVVDVKLDGTSGTVQLGLIFTPNYIQRARQGTSTFGTAGKVAGAPIKTVGKGVGLVGSGVGVVGGAAVGGISKTGSFLTKGFLRRKSRSGQELEDPASHPEMTEGGDVPPVPTIVQSIEGGDPHTPQRAASIAPSRRSISGANSPNGASVEQGLANITLLSASGFPLASNIRVIIKVDVPGKPSKEAHKSKAHKAPRGEADFESEACRVPCSADSSFRVAVVDHHTFGSDTELGEGTFYVADQGSGAEQVITMKEGTGKVTLRTSFMASDRASISGNRLSRFGVGARTTREKSATPGA
jgi:hypothetical protein